MFFFLTHTTFYQCSKSFYCKYFHVLQVKKEILINVLIQKKLKNLLVYAFNDISRFHYLSSIKLINVYVLKL